jgi:hypothetical protein
MIRKRSILPSCPILWKLVDRGLGPDFEKRKKKKKKERKKIVGGIIFASI